MSETQWYYAINQQQFGPVSESKMIELFQNGNINAQSYVWTDGLEDWKHAFEIEEFLPYLPAQPPAAVTYLPSVQRPTSVTVFGILNIIFGSLGLLCMPFSIAFIFMPSEMMDPTEIVYAWLLFGSVLGIFTSGLQLALGIGLLKLKAWARKWTVYYAWFSIFWAVISTVINILLVVSNQYNYTQQALPGVYGGMCGGLIGGIIYPVLLIVFMNKQIAKDACMK